MKLNSKGTKMKLMFILRKFILMHITLLTKTSFFIFSCSRKAPDAKVKWNATRSGSTCSNRYIENSEGVLVCEEDIDHENERLLVEQPVGGWLKKACKRPTYQEETKIVNSHK